MNIVVPKARAWVYAGNWVADCPRACGNVELLYEPVRKGGPLARKKTMFRCSYCGMETHAIEWPQDENGIMEVLGRRPIPHNRNWFPKDHPLALKSRCPHGQSVQDLIEENHENGVE